MTVGTERSLLRRLKDAEANATPGPWEWEYAGEHGRMGEAELYGNCQHPGEGEFLGLLERGESDRIKADADLVVAARNALPAVLRLVEAAQQLVSMRDLNATDTENWRKLVYGFDALDAALALFMEEES